MAHDQVRPFAAMTHDELRALSDALARCAEDIGQQRAMVQAELQRRDGPQPVKAGDVATAGPRARIALSYLPVESAVSPSLVTGDSYADFARMYALKMVAVWFAVGLALLIGCCVLAAAR